MLKHNLLLIYRSFKRFKSTFFINLIGLSSSLACAILIYLWIADELNFDKFHEKHERLFQVMEHEQVEGSIKTSGHTSDFLAETLNEEMPEVEYATVVTPPNFFPSFTLSVSDNHVKGVGKFAGKDFFNIFSYVLVHGNPNQVLTGKNNIAISESLAKKLFATTENSIGKSIEWQLMFLKKEVSIAGVFKDVPANSSEQFDFILSFDSFKDLIGIQGTEVNWDNAAPFLTYIVTKEKADIDKLNDKMGDFLKRKGKNSQHRTLFLRPYVDNYLHGHYENGVETGGRIEYVNLFSVIAIFIVLIACINFMNLSTAKALRRIKEVGIKKAIGAQRKTLVYQYLVESMSMAFLSILIAGLVVQLLLPQFSLLTGKYLTLFSDRRIVLVFVALAFATGLLAGGYPALYLSSFNPAKVLKGQFNTSIGELWARKGLVIFQFTLSVIFLVSVLVVYKQIEFVQTKNLGYDKENLIYFETEGRVAENAQTFISEVKKISGVLNASSMLGNILSPSQTEGGGLAGTLEWEGKVVMLNNTAVNYELIELLGIEMKEGRTFSREFGSDSAKVIYNEAAIEAIGLKNPVGKIVGGKEILGIVKNFHFQSLHEIVKPYCFRLEPESASTILVKIRSGTEAQTVNELQKFYTGYNPGFTFNYKFLDQEYAAQYVAEKKVGLLSQYFAGLAMIISCLGIFGLAAFTIEKRNKEIGIRKVLGSSEFGIVFLLSNDFTKMVVTAILIGLPISYFISVYWLGNFAYKIELKLWYFLSAGAMTLAIAWLTIGIQTIKAAKTNPVARLRSE